MTLLAPSAGLVSLVTVWHPGGEAQFKPGRAGVAGLRRSPNSRMLPRCASRRAWTRRSAGDWRLNQPATVQLDAIPDRQFSGKLEQIGTIATSDFSGGLANPSSISILQIVARSEGPATEARHDCADYRGGRSDSRCHHHSGAGLFSEVGTDSGLCGGGCEISGAADRSGPEKPRSYFGLQRFTARGSGGASGSFW